jgi:hypothetical protein
VRPTAWKCALSWQILLGSLATVKLLCVPPASSPTNGRPGICGRLVPQTCHKFPTTNSYHKFPTTNSRRLYHKLYHKSLEKSIAKFLIYHNCHKLPDRSSNDADTQTV